MRYQVAAATLAIILFPVWCLGWVAAFVRGGFVAGWSECNRVMEALVEIVTPTETR